MNVLCAIEVAGPTLTATVAFAAWTLPDDPVAPGSLPGKIAWTIADR